MTWDRRGFVGAAMLGFAGAALAGLATAVERHSYILLEFSEPPPGRPYDLDAKWRKHLASMIAISGFLTATPFNRSSIQLRRPSAMPPPARLALYTLATADLPALCTRMRQEVDPGDMVLVYRQGRVWSASSMPSAGEAYLQLVITNAMPGQDARYNQWYEEVHAGELLSVPGVFRVGRGFHENVSVTPQSTAPEYLSLMSFKTASIDEFRDELEDLSRKLTGSDSYDADHAWRHLYKQAGPVVGSTVRSSAAPR
jgi:hypothetical protein